MNGFIEVSIHLNLVLYRSEVFILLSRMSCLFIVTVIMKVIFYFEEKYNISFTKLKCRLIMILFKDLQQIKLTKTLYKSKEIGKNNFVFELSIIIFDMCFVITMSVLIFKIINYNLKSFLIN